MSLPKHPPDPEDAEAGIEVERPGDDQSFEGPVGIPPTFDEIVSEIVDDVFAYLSGVVPFVGSVKDSNDLGGD